MLKTIWARAHHGHRTIEFPNAEPAVPERFRGLPKLDPLRCQASCRNCADACPSDAVRTVPRLEIDLGRCLFCGDCVDACPKGAIEFTKDYRLAVRKRENLHLAQTLELAAALQGEMKRLFGRSLKLRQVSAGGCNACEVDVNVLNTIVFDLGRFGVQFVASPRHADGMLVTGPVTENMREALIKTYEAIPAPKLVIATGACAISGGLFRDHAEAGPGLEGIVPIDLYIPGCPPHPITILDGLLRLLGRR